MVKDVWRAYFFAKRQLHVFIDLPQEDDEAKEGDVGQLLLCLYGTRDAAKERQKTLSKHLQDIGLIPRRGIPAVFHHPEWDMRVLVHGDDYPTSGHVGDPGWMKSLLEYQYTIQAQRVGNGVDRHIEGKILNRVRWTPNGYEMKADPRHCELILKQLDIEKHQATQHPWC